MQIKTLSLEKISILGGWPQNDSITFMAYTEDNGNSWEINDLFPGKMLNTGLYYNSGKVIAAGLNGAWYKSYNFGKNWETSSAGIDLNHKNVNSLKQGMGDRALGCGGPVELMALLLCLMIMVKTVLFKIILKMRSIIFQDIPMIN